MSFTADQLGMRVVVPGSGRVVENTYIGDASTTFVKGDLIRIDTSGQVVDAATDSDTTGAVHGMILEDWTTAPAATQYPKVFLFSGDTVLETQVYNATAADAEPQDVTVGVSYTLRNGAAGKWSITTTDTKGIATVTARAGQSRWFEPAAAVDEDYGLVYIKFAQSILDGHSA